MSTAKLDLITMLLSKAESTTPEEAKALTDHAERPMLKNGTGERGPILVAQQWAA